MCGSILSEDAGRRAVAKTSLVGIPSDESRAVSAKSPSTSKTAAFVFALSCLYAIFARGRDVDEHEVKDIPQEDI